MLRHCSCGPIDYFNEKTQSSKMGSFSFYFLASSLSHWASLLVAIQLNFFPVCQWRYRCWSNEGGAEGKKGRRCSSFPLQGALSTCSIDGAILGLQLWWLVCFPWKREINKKNRNERWIDTSVAKWTLFGAALPPCMNSPRGGQKNS